MAKVYYLLVMRIFFVCFLVYIFSFAIHLFVFSFHCALTHNYLLLDCCVKPVYICAFLVTQIYTFTYFYSVHLIQIKTYETLILIVGDRFLEGLYFDFLKLHTHVDVCVCGGGGGRTHLNNKCQASHNYRYLP